MRRIIALALVCTALVVTLCSLAGARKPGIVTSFNQRLRPVAIPETTGTVEMELQFGAPVRHLRACGAIQVTISVDGLLVYGGQENFEVKLVEDLEYRGSLVVTIPPSDEALPTVSSLKVTIECGDLVSSLGATFIVLGEVVKYVPSWRLDRPATYYFPELKAPPQKAPKSAADQYWAQFGLSKETHPDRSNLTEEQLQTKHTVAIGLGDADLLALAESLLGPIPDSAAVPGTKGGFILDISLDHLLQLAEAGAEFDPTPEYREKLLKRQIKVED
jgi:hypothetical protein